MRDALLIRELTDAIKAGDSGRLEISLKTFTLSYRGGGRTKYAHEMLHIRHNLAHIWPKPLRYVLFPFFVILVLRRIHSCYGSVRLGRSCLTIGSPTRQDAYVPLDLLQEHMNFWIKVSCHFPCIR